MEANTASKSKTIAIICLLAGFLALLLCVYQSSVIFSCNVSSMAADNFGIRRFGEFFLFFAALLIFCAILGKERLFKYRFLIAIVCFIICVALEITGSSIGCFAGNAEKNLLLGVSRDIRSDEWTILTPMTWTQYMDPAGTFSYFNSVIRAESTDVFLEYGLPINTPLMVFKPFLLGYLFLPIAKGMAFFWCGRFIVLAMVSFEFGRFITNDKRLLALIYSVMIVFSPVVQWWFAINGFVEMLIFFQLSVLLFDRFLKDGNPWRRLLYATVIGICAGGYALTMYPAWMIPLAYVLLGCMIWVFYTNYKQGSIKRVGKTDLLSIFLVIVMLTISAVHIYNNSHETFATLANTIYPGQRLENGGHSSLKELFSFIPSVWYSANGGLYGVNGNVCDCAFFIILFPSGYLLFFRRLMKKKNDALCAIMVIVSVFLLIYCVVGLPEKVAALSLLQYSMSRRTLVIWSFANVILLIRLISLFSDERDKIKTNESKSSKIPGRLIPYVIMCGMAVMGICISYRINASFYNKSMIIIEALLFIPLYCLLCNNRRRTMLLWGITMTSVCLISSALANPVRSGVDDIIANPNVQMIKQVVKKDPKAIWIVEGEWFPSTNLPLLAGARTINCTNIYPDIERWRIIDPKRKYEKCYNRYAAVIQVIRKNGHNDGKKFVLYNTLSYTVYLSDEEIKSLGTKYILSRNSLSGNGLNLIKSNGIYSVYMID